MTETRSVSIDEVRALVTERQRYDDWLTALEARRDETPARVFERVHGDYRTRRADVMSRLREHVPGLASLGNELDARLSALESQLGTLEDERAEAMLRTAVGEFDADRWEQVRHNVEAQIGQLGESRTALLTEVDEVRTLLSSARTEPEVVEPEVVAEVPAETPEAFVEIAPIAEPAPVELAIDENAGMIDIDVPTVIVESTGSIEETFGETVDIQPIPASASAEEMADLDNALALFAGDAASQPHQPPIVPTMPTPQHLEMPGATLPPSLDGLDVFDDAELGDLRMSPPSRATATVTPQSSSSTSGATGSRDGFDDLAFLRSVVDPSTQGGVARGAATGDQQKTLRCTECGTMNLPTEWYCERCGGELAAF